MVKERDYMVIKTILFTMLVVCLSFAGIATAYATPGASLLYYETDLGGGTWQYDYTFYNTSDAGESLYSVYFYFTQDTEFTGTSLGTGWDGNVWDGTGWTTNFTDTYSTGTGYDIAAGRSLSGFAFTVDYQAGDISYDAYLSTTNGNEQISGTTALVPEPVSSILFVTGGTLLAGRRYLRRNKS